MISKILQNFLRLGEISVFLVALGFEFFGPAQNPLNFVQLPAIIILYVAIGIACIAKIFDDIQRSIQDPSYRTLKRFFSTGSSIISFIGRVVFQVVIVWTIVNSIQYKRERTKNFAFTLAVINLCIMLIKLISLIFKKPQTAHAKLE